MVSCCSFTLTNSQLSIDRTIVWLVVVVRFSPFVHPSLIAPPFATSSPCHSRSCCRDSQMGWYGSAKPAWSAEGWCNWNWTSTYRSMVFVDLDVPQLGSIRNQKKLNMCSLSLSVTVSAFVGCEPLCSKPVRDQQWWRCPVLLASSPSRKLQFFVAESIHGLVCSVPALSATSPCDSKVPHILWLVLPKVHSKYASIDFGRSNSYHRSDTANGESRRHCYPRVKDWKMKENCENPLFTVSRLWNHSFKTVMVQRQCVSGFKFKFSVITHRHLGWHLPFHFAF